MPLTSTVTSIDFKEGFFDASGSISNTGADYITYDGCSSAYTSPDSSSGNSGILIISSVMNKKYVKATDSFQLSLYAVSSGSLYNIIGLTTGLSISTFVTGDVTSFALVATTEDVQATTTYIITMKPSHYIQSSS